MLNSTTVIFAYTIDKLGNNLRLDKFMSEQ
jgi:hypothetical protein